MNAFQLLGATDPGLIRPVCVIHGDDAYLRREATRAVVRLAMGATDDGMAPARFAGAQADLARVLDEVRTLPFLDPRRVALVEEADPFVSANRKELEAYAEGPSGPGVLILSVKSWPSNTKLAKVVGRTGLAVDCKGPPERELPSWIAKLAKERWSLSMGPEASRLLVELVGPETGLLVAELDKLAAFVGERKTIKAAEVPEVVGDGRVLAVWDLIDRATTGDAAGALAVLDRLLNGGEAPQRLIAAMGHSLGRLHHAGRLRIARRPLEQACKEAGVRNVGLAGRQHRHLGPSRVDALPNRLLAADLDLKGGTMLDVRQVMERLVIDLARPRRD